MTKKETAKNQPPKISAPLSSWTPIPQVLINRQKLREQAIGTREVERYYGPKIKKGPDTATLRLLLEEAVLNLLAGQGEAQAHKREQDIGSLREHLRKNTLKPVQEALKNLLAAKRGQPSNTKKFWDLLELPAEENSSEFVEFSEIVFYSTLYELLLSVLIAENKTPTVDIADVEIEPDEVSDENSAEESDNSLASAVNYANNTEQREWLPERQLYHRVWQSFLIHLVTWLSNGEVKIPSWRLNNAVGSDSLNGGVLDEPVEELLEKAFIFALERPKIQIGGKKGKPTKLDKLATARSTADKGKPPQSNSEEPLELPAKPFSEAAEEFAANLVNIVASLTVDSDGLFAWFKRQQPDGKRRTLAAWVPTPQLLKRLETISVGSKTYTVPVNAPLIIPPRPWTAGNMLQGGYYLRNLEFFKFHLKNDRIRDFLNECKQQEIGQTLDAVNAIQSTSFRINRRVWNVVQQLSARSKQLRGKRKPKDWGAREDLDSWIENRFMPEAFKKNKQGVGDRIANPLTWKMVDDLSTIENGNSETFYFAYQADSRGRLYPVAQWLSPQGEDLSRALLEFADGKPISNEGVGYLAIHGSQQLRFEDILHDLGVEEERPVTLEERLQWVERHKANIASYAADPLKHLGWTQAKQPFQFLAFCFAWADYLEKGVESICHLPVHVDGVCNGLQHIAALTGNAALAAATNLQGGDPQDIYLHVKSLALQALEKSAKTNPYAKFAIEHRLVDRDLAKSVVMIIPYGAGERGYTRAVLNRLRQIMFPEKIGFNNPTKLGEYFLQFIKDHFPESVKETHDKHGRRRQPIIEHLSELSTAIASTFKAVLNKHFPAITEFRRRLISSAEPVWLNGIPMMWQTPSGLPVIQRNFRIAKVVVDSKISSAVFGDLQLNATKNSTFATRLRFTTERVSNEVYERDQASGMLPNFIHSLDCAHLIKTVQLAKESGISHFSMIHDSYGTHAADMPVLAKCIREAFVELYCADKISVLSRFEQWCAVLSIAARSPLIGVEEFKHHIHLTETEKALYNLAARWAGRDSMMMNELARETPKLMERMIKAGDAKGLNSSTFKKLLVFAATEIDLEWPKDEMAQSVLLSRLIELEWPHDEKQADLSKVMESEYFFS